MKRLPVLLAALTLLLTSVAAGPAQAAPQREGFLVGFTVAPGASERALVERHGGTISAEFPEVAAFAVALDPGSVAALARARSVAYVERDEMRYAMGLSDAQLVPSLSNGLYGLITTRAIDVHSRGVTGSGVKACVADTSLEYTHPDIAANYRGGIDTVGVGDNDPINDDGQTHGTHVAGTVLGVNNTTGIYGVAYGAELYHARVLGPTGGTTSDIMEGVRWLIQTAGCKVVNLSLGGSFKSRTEEKFYIEMRNRGALVVAAAGNDAARKLSYPAGYPVNISVGAVDSANAHASFSNVGRGLDISAPGVSVLSSVPIGQGGEASVSAGATYFAQGLEFAPRTEGVTGTLVDCGIGGVGDCPAEVAGNIALIQRGTLSFADKVTNARDAGATAVIIYNNAPGEFSGTLGGTGAWIPAVSVSDTTGATLLGQLGSSATVVDRISDWDHYDGTSMATPHVTGVIALIWSANPGLPAATVESYLFNGATDLGAAGYDTTFGRGMVNADASVRAAGG